MKVFVLELFDSTEREWMIQSLHKTLEGATRAKYEHLSKNPLDKMFISEQEVQE